MECLLLKEEYNASFTLAGTVYTVHIPQDGLVYVSSIPGKGADSIVVEYGDYNGLIVPVSMCRAIPEDDVSCMTHLWKSASAWTGTVTARTNFP